MITNEQLELNQKFIDLGYSYIDSEVGETNYYFDPKSFMKWLWNHGYKISLR